LFGLITNSPSSKLLLLILKYLKNFFGYIWKSSYSLWNWPFSALWLILDVPQFFFPCPSSSQ
jgi:hypothetical protein